MFLPRRRGGVQFNTGLAYVDDDEGPYRSPAQIRQYQASEEYLKNAYKTGIWKENAFDFAWASESRREYEGEEGEGNIWTIYNEKAANSDKDLVKDFNESMDVMLIFAGLFSAVLTGFIIETYHLLQPDQGDLTNQLLFALLSQQPASSVDISAQFKPSTQAVRINTLFFASLVCSLLAALSAIMVKTWVNHYDSGLSSLGAQLRARTRQLRSDGFKRWHVPEIISFVPTIMHISLFLFFIGLTDFLFSINRTVATVILSLLSVGALFYISTTVIPLLSSAAPFITPFTHLLERTILRTRQLGSQSAKQKESGLEDPHILLFGHEKPDIRTAQYQKSLDVDAICWLLQTSDKTTERDVADKCFETLRTFRLIARTDPEAFDKKHILLAHSAMTLSCFSYPQGYIPRYRIRRARALCRYMFWYLSFPNRSAESSRWLSSHLPSDQLKLALALSSYGTYHESTHDVVLGHLMESKIIHLDSLGPCNKCIAKTTVYEYFVGLRNTQRDQNTADLLSLYLISLTDCVMTNYNARVVVQPPELRGLVHTALQYAVVLIQLFPKSQARFTGLETHLKHKEYPLHPPGVWWRNTLLKAINDRPEEPPELRSYSTESVDYPDTATRFREYGNATQDPDSGPRVVTDVTRSTENRSRNDWTSNPVILNQNPPSPMLAPVVLSWYRRPNQNQVSSVIPLEEPLIPLPPRSGNP